MAEGSSKFWSDIIIRILREFLKAVGVKPRRKLRHQHVVPHDDGWAVRGSGNKRLTGVFPTQVQAVLRASQIARNYKSDVIIHGRDGKIRDRINYD